MWVSSGWRPHRVPLEVYVGVGRQPDAAIGYTGYGRAVAISDLVTRAERRVDRVPAIAQDAALAALCLVVGVLTTGATTEAGVTHEARGPLAWALILLATVPYALRRRAPMPVFLVTLSAVVALMLGGYDSGALPWVVLVGAYTVAAYRPTRELAFAAVFALALLIALLVGPTRDFGAGEFLSGVAAFAVVMIIGWTMQARRQRIDSFDDEQEEAARRAATEERLRIAQELHDVVAHSLGVIAVQAGVGMHVIDSDPDEARRALENISRASRTSLTEIRRLLGMVRDSEGVPRYAPAPGLADLPRLVEGVTGVGLAVDVRVEGDIDAVPGSVGVTAYRIVQEALTNTLRHAEAHRATVRLDTTPGELRIEVADDGRGPTGASLGGHGLVGMRERVAVYGGSLEVGPDATGGFRIAARLPYEDSLA